MSDGDNKGNTEATLMGLPEVPSARSTTDRSPVYEPTPTAPELAPLDSTTAPSLPPVAEAPRSRSGTAIPRAKTGGAIPKAHGAPRRPSRLATEALPGPVPRAEQLPRRASRIAVATTEGVPTVAPLRAVGAPGFEWTLPKVAGLAGALCLMLMLGWLFWPATAPAPAPIAAPPEALLEEPTPKPAPIAAAIAEKKAPSPAKPTLSLDAKLHVIDPFASHHADLPLDPAHKYRLHLPREDGRIGHVLARLDEQAGWGVMHKMATHAALQFGGVKALRLHCTPGTHFAAGQTIALELTDLATRAKVTTNVEPSRDCWDFGVTRTLELGEGVKKRVRVPTDSTVRVGEQVPLRVGWILEALGEEKQWRTGVLSPGESMLAEGRLVRFALLDPYAGDNDGTLELELLSGDTESSGLVTPAAGGAQFVPLK